MKNVYSFLLVSIFYFSTFSFSQDNRLIFSWQYQGQPSLELTESVGMVIQEDGFAADPEALRHFITIEDVDIPLYSQISQLFVSFGKINYTSFVVVKIFDTFTDHLLSEIKFNETGIVSIDDTYNYPNRIYFKVELFGQDIRLRSAGISMESQTIIEPKNLTLSSKIIYLSNDILKIQAKLNQEAEVQLYVYDNTGSVNEKIAHNQIYSAGVYDFYWNPDSLLLHSGTPFYIWFRARNLRSEPVEYIRNILVIP